MRTLIWKHIKMKFKKNGSFGMLFVVSLSQGKPWFMNVCVTYMLLLPCCWQKFFEYCFGVVLLIFIPRAFMQENKFSHVFMPWEYGMHNFSAIRYFFGCIYVIQSRCIYKFTQGNTDYWRKGVSSGFGNVLIFLPFKWLQCVKLLQKGCNGKGSGKS